MKHKELQYQLERQEQIYKEEIGRIEEEQNRKLKKLARERQRQRYEADIQRHLRHEAEER